MPHGEEYEQLLEAVSTIPHSHWQPAKKQGSQSYNNKELNSVNNKHELERRHQAPAEKAANNTYSL